MSWNYRVMRFRDAEGGGPRQSIHEVYYDEAGRPAMWTAKPCGLVAFEENGEDLREMLAKMFASLDKPVLTEDDFK